jgi:hypothetical protein
MGRDNQISFCEGPTTKNNFFLNLFLEEEEEGRGHTTNFFFRLVPDADVC